MTPRHSLPSRLMSLDDAPGPPSARLFELAAMLAVIVPGMSHPILTPRSALGPRWFEQFPGEHYHLLTALCSLLKPASVWEFGTDVGMGSLALLEGMDAHAVLTTVDIDPWASRAAPWLRQDDFAAGRVRQLACDMVSDTVFVAQREALSQADLILLDGPKDGVTEATFLRRLAEVAFVRPPIVVIDDTRVLNMVELWRGLERPKLDFTSFGHWSGTGLVDWQPLQVLPQALAPPPPPQPPPAFPRAGPGQSMRILMLCHERPNYVPDLLLHGLRKLHGPAVVEFPRKDALYAGWLGQSNLDPVPGLMAPDDEVDRTDLVEKLACGFFHFVLVDIRAARANQTLLRGNTCRLAVIDGEDLPVHVKPGRYVILRRETDGGDFSVPLPISVPDEVLDWIERHAAAPKTHSIGFLGSRSRLTPERHALLDTLANRFPDALLQGFDALGQHWHGRDAYYRAMQGCLAVLSLPGVGRDTFRYWENAGCRAAHVARRSDLLIPNDFREASEILRFSDLAELTEMVERVEAGQVDWQAMAARSRTWLRLHHTTQRRAQATLARLEAAFLD